MNMRIAVSLGITLGVIAVGTVSAATVWLDELNLDSATQGWGEPHKNQSVDGNPLTIAGKKFARGFGTHAESLLKIKIEGGAQKFTASVGVDDEIKNNPAASIEFIVEGDGKALWRSGVMRAGDAAKSCDVDLAGVKALALKVTDAGHGINYDHADWAEAKFEIAAGAKLTAGGPPLPKVAPYILTPPAPATPRINGPNVFGVRPGSPFLYTIPASGERPMKFTVESLPAGLQLDAGSGRITGVLKDKGEYAVTLRATNARGSSEKKFRIVCGDQLALTPPLGWNSWNCFAGEVSAERVKIAAAAMVKSGLINHGWTYINIDDFWQNHRDSKDQTLRGPFRDVQGNIVPNSRFPDMQGLADYVHGLGLKIGLYSSPGPWTCGGCAGSFRHEQQDAQIYAKWGFDYLKYDWCSYGTVAAGGDPDAKDIPLWGKNPRDNEGAIYPYRIMGKFLREQPRDIVFSLCQYGMADVWKWGGSVNGNCWRTTGDITDTWKSMSGIGFKQDQAAPYAKPGNWNDPDMLVVGQVGWGRLHPTHLNPDEQYTHISLWCLLAAPLLIGCDMEKFDDFTLNLLSNDEVLAVDQDALGKQATCVITEGELRVYVKELEDGGRAVGFFNLSTASAKLELKDFAARLGLSGKLRVRDLWRQQDVADGRAFTVPPHGVVLYKVTAEKR
jgi:alpha-galactosidase